MKTTPKEKILIISESIDVEDSSGTKGRVSLIRNLHKAGFKIKVLHYTRKEIHLDGIPCVAIREKRRSFYYFLSRIERHLRYKLNLDLHRPLEKIFGFSFTLFNDRNSIVQELKKIKDFDPSLVLTLSKGGSFRPHHALLAMPEWHDRWIAYIHDPYPMHLYPRPYAWVEPGYMNKWKFVKELSEKAKYSAFPSQLLLEWMGSYFGDFFRTGVVIPHQLQEIDSPNALPAYMKSNKFTIVHAGNLLHARNPKGLVEGFKLFIKRNPEAEGEALLLFIGATNYFQDYLNKVSEEEASINFVPDNQPLQEVDRVQKAAAVNIILEAKSEISPFLPGKFPFCISANKPILLLGPYYSESRRLMGEDYRYWAEIDQVERITSLLEELYKTWKKNPSTTLDREDLKFYLSEKYLKKTIQQLVD
ncbi:UDP-glycosyltransferase [Salinimicrobium soli]|uniref:UDP-glycosyltransferase n=1 Tax=Salinimicrobium soli TaxID=1254399 RepID=UPI003AAA5C6B